MHIYLDVKLNVNIQYIILTNQIYREYTVNIINYDRHM